MRTPGTADYRQGRQGAFVPSRSAPSLPGSHLDLFRGNLNHRGGRVYPADGCAKGHPFCRSSSQVPVEGRNEKTTRLLEWFFSPGYRPTYARHPKLASSGPTSLSVPRDFLRRGFTSRFLKPVLASLTHSVEARMFLRPVSGLR